uniref:Uncharacterized protein n=1 Tax=Strigamia maritima TaxID=126957 RepID=T1IVT1_STRMM
MTMGLDWAFAFYVSPVVIPRLNLARNPLGSCCIIDLSSQIRFVLSDGTKARLKGNETDVQEREKRESRIKNGGRLMFCVCKRVEATTIVIH